jgi:hypothetical protein
VHFLWRYFAAQKVIKSNESTKRASQTLQLDGRFQSDLTIDADEFFSVMSLDFQFFALDVKNVIFFLHVRAALWFFGIVEKGDGFHQPTFFGDDDVDQTVVEFRQRSEMESSTGTACVLSEEHEEIFVGARAFALH